MKKQAVNGSFKLLLAVIAISTAIYSTEVTAAPKKSTATVAASEPPIRAGTAISVLKFDRTNRTLIVQINAEPAVGPNFATPESLVAAIDIDDGDQRKAYIDDPGRFVGGVFTLKKTLKLVPPKAEKK